MTNNQVKDFVIKKLLEQEIEVSSVRVKNYKKEEKTIEKIVVSINNIEANGIVPHVKTTLDDLYYIYGIETKERLIEI